MMGCPHAVLLGNDFLMLPLLAQGIQPFALQGIIHASGTIHFHHLSRGNIEDQKHGVVIRSAPIASNDVLMPGLRVESDRLSPLPPHAGRRYLPG